MVIIWCSLAALFLILELVTFVFYGLALSIGSLCVAGYIAITGDVNSYVIHCFIFGIVSILSAYIFSKFFSSNKSKDKVQGLDIYLGQTHNVNLVNKNFKITLDGVAYLVSSDDELQDGDSVTILKRKGALFIVEKNK